MGTTTNTYGYAAHDSSGHLSPFKFSRREVGPLDVEIDIKFCGICHSDLHQIKNEWNGSSYPMVPGHEIAGVITRVGDKVTKFRVGQHAGVGCLVNSCRECDACHKHLEQFCPKQVGTYNGKDVDGRPTYGGYSNRMVVDEAFTLRIPDNVPLEKAGPLMCAGITTFSPMMHFGMNEPGKKLGVVGLGGLGHMAVKFGKAMDLFVVVLSRSPSKEKEALEVMKADKFLVTEDPEQFKAAEGTLDYIIDTVSAKHDLAAYMKLLAVDGKYVTVGIPPEPYSISASSLIFGRKMWAGSLIGGIEETQKMLDFCSEHNVTPLTETVAMDYVNTAMERLHKADVKYRFVIDMSTLKES